MQEIMNMVDNYAKAVSELDEGLFRSLWDDSLQPSFVHPRGYSAGLENIVNEFFLGTMGLFSTRSLRPRDVEIAVNGDSALVFFYWNFTAYFKEDGSRKDTEGRETQYFVKVNGQWKLGHIHYSGMPVTGEREGF